MRARYVAAILSDQARQANMKERLCGRGLAPVYARGPLSLFASAPGIELAGRGLVLGTLHSTGKPSGHLGAAEQRDALDSGGHSLIAHKWGGYVAFMLSPGLDAVDILRSPFGDLPCYYWRSRETILIASDIAGLVAAGMHRPSVDFAALGRHIAAEDLRRSETCLARVVELQGGEMLTLRGSESSTSTMWTPWSFTSAEQQIVDASEAAAEVRASAIQVVASSAAAFPKVLLKLSGGLDSSIVAACLAGQRVDFAALNLVTDHPAGDERDYARQVARHLGVPLMERLRRIEDVDLQRSAAARLPRPTARAFTQASAALAREAANEFGTAAVFDGGGGDNVFCSLQSARPVADCLLDRAGRAAFRSTAKSVAALAEVSLWAVARRAVAQALRRSPAYPWDVDPRFMAEDAAAAVRSGIRHRWLEPPEGASPGKAAHVALIAAAQSVAEGADVETDLPEYSPLIAQPLVQTCLRVPTWLWVGDGHNRFAARQAFAGELPPPVVERRSKGAPDCFVADIYEANRTKIRDMLLGGVLADAKLVDASAIEVALADLAPVQGHDFLRIMHLADAEAWARSWS